MAAAAAVAAGGYYLLRPVPTPEEVKNPVDQQYEELSIAINQLTAEGQQPGANIDSMTLVLEALRWNSVDDGGEYEQQKRNLYLDAKRNAAMSFRQVLTDRGEEIHIPLLDDVEQINE